MENKEKPDSWYSSLDNWKKLKPFARKMRDEMTFSERVLWKYLRNRQILGYKFRRQHVIGSYIVDFYCHELKLVIEVDGLSHEEQILYDQKRQDYLVISGFSVLRFKNEDVVQNTSGVIDELIFQINQIHQNPT